MRASDADRHKAVAALAAGFRRGCLSTDTFERRAGDAYAARSVGELDALAPDIAARRSLWSVLRRTARWVWWGGADQRMLLSPPPALPDPGTGLVIGRAPDCSMVIDDPTVSRRHARLVPHRDGWQLVDLGSTNGTAVNGWRVEEALVRDGDEIALGATTVVLAERSA